MSAQSVIVVSEQFTRVVYAKPSFCSAQDRDLMLVTMTDKELYGVVSENGIYGHSRFCNTDFDDKLACLNLSGV